MPDIETNFTPSLETGGEGSTTAASFDNTGKAVELTTETSGSLAYNGDTNALELDIEDGLDADAAEDKSQEDTTAEDAKEGDTGDESASEDSDAEDLPEFNPDDDEVVSKYDAKYTNEDGTLNLNAFNASVQASYDKDGKADITAQERAYVKAVFGVSDAAIDDHLAGIEARAALADQKFYEAAGGKETYDSMLAWARSEGGYTEAQRERFNKAVKAGPGEDLTEQLELLKTRFAAAGGKAPSASDKAAQGNRFRDRRKASPDKVAGGSSSAAPSVVPFKDEAEFRAAQKEAGEDQKKYAEMQKRLKASPALWKR